uniref:Uncharacterized protein n=1 Tax=Timema tahoe TaxID=61484 RepID=A0A7R9IP78_9NEOP|nr:unnamed protein product [Timema tahoe]
MYDDYYKITLLININGLLKSQIAVVYDSSRYYWSLICTVWYLIAQDTIGRSYVQSVGVPTEGCTPLRDTRFAGVSNRVNSASWSYLSSGSGLEN